MSPWEKLLAAELATASREHRTEDQEMLQQLGYDDPLARVVGMNDATDFFRRTALAHHMFGFCRTEIEKVLLACMMMTWPRRCALQWKWNEAGQYTSFKYTKLFSEEPLDEDDDFAHFGYRLARVHVYQRQEGPHTLGIAVDLWSKVELGQDEPPEMWRSEYVRVKCNIECGPADWERDVSLQNIGYLVLRVATEELQKDPVAVARSLLSTLIRELERRTAELEQQQKLRGLRLVTP